MYNAVYYWNNTDYYHNFAQYDNNSQNTAYCTSTTQAWYGAYSIIASNGTNQYHTTSQFKIYLNTNKLSGNSNWQLSTSCHEIGHALGLLDSNNPYINAVMDTNRNRDIIKTPQSDDQKGADANYHRY